jgi:ribose-phosphate pyrophosphokinase
VLPYFPYNRQSKKKSHRGAITARMLANLMHVAGVKHVVTVDLHASQMQGFFKCPVDNLHAEPLIARWIRLNIPNWKEAVVVSKNAGGTKRVTSLADALKLNFGIVTTDRKRATGNMTASMIMNHLDGLPAVLNAAARPAQATEEGESASSPGRNSRSSPSRRASRTRADSQGSPRRVNGNGSSAQTNGLSRRALHTSTADSLFDEAAEEDAEAQHYTDERAQVVTQGRLVQGHIVPDDYNSATQSEAGEGSYQNTEAEDPMTMSHASSFFAPEPHALGGSGDAEPSSDEEDEKLKDPRLEHMITLVGDVKDRPVLIVDDMMDKAGSWIAAAETVVKRGHAKKVYCIATHGVFGGEALEQLQACECIDQIIVTNSFPIPERKAKNASKLVILDLSFLLSEAIRRNHYGESISPLFQHIAD